MNELSNDEPQQKEWRDNTVEKEAAPMKANRVYMSEVDDELVVFNGSIVDALESELLVFKQDDMGMESSL